MARTETKPAFQTTEMVAYVIVTIAVLIAGAVDGSGATSIRLYVTILTVGDIVSRGLAKSGSYEPRIDDRP